MANNSAKDFESTMESLETVVERLEGGELTLEEQLQEYEKGVKLAKSCTEMLENAKMRLNKVSAEANAKENDSE